MMDAPTAPPPADARDAPDGGGTRWKGRAYWYDRGMPRLPALPSPEAARRSRRRKRLIAVACVLVLLLPVLFIASSNHGFYYTYRYSVTVDNVEAPFLITIPVITVNGEELLPYLDIEELLPGGCRLNATEHGLGLELWGDEPLTLALRGEYNACVHSSDHVSDGNPVPSMSTYSSKNGYDHLGMGSAWMSSNVSGLKIHVYFTRNGHYWFGNSILGWNERAGILVQFSIIAESTVGWTSVDVLALRKQAG